MLARSHHVTRSLYVLIALFLQPCGPCDKWYAAELGSQRDFKSARFLTLEQEGIRAKVTAYKNFDVSLGEAFKVKGDRRLTFRGIRKEPSGAFAAVHGPAARYNLSLGATWAFNDFKGLTPMTAAGYMVTRYPGNAVRQLNVFPRNDLTLKEGGTLFGFTVEAYDENGLLTSVDFFDTAELDVRMEQNDTQFLFMVRPTPTGLVGEKGDPNPFTTIATLDRLPSTEDVETEFGANGLGKGGKLFVDDFWFIKGEPPLVTDYSDEEILSGDFLGVARCLSDAMNVLSVPEPGVPEIQSALSITNQVFSTSLGIMSQIESGIENETFLPSTQFKLAWNVSRLIYKRSNKLTQMLFKFEENGQITPKQVNSVTNTMHKLYERAHVGAANMQGYRAKNLKQLDFLYCIEDRYLPLWAQQAEN